MFKDQEGVRSRKQKEDENRAHNLEFYRSLVEQYIQMGERDMLTEQLLDDIRSHLSISDEEHLHLILTLRKREQHILQRSGGTNENIQVEIKREMAQLLDDIKKEKQVKTGIKTEKDTPTFRNEGEIDPLERDPIEKPPDGTTHAGDHGQYEGKGVTDMKKKDEGRCHSDGTAHKELKDVLDHTKVDWEDELEYGSEPIIATAPRPGLEEGNKPIPVHAPVPGMKESSEPLPLEPSSIDNETEIPLGVMVDNGTPHPVQTLIDRPTSIHHPLDHPEVKTAGSKLQQGTEIERPILTSEHDKDLRKDPLAEGSIGTIEIDNEGMEEELEDLDEDEIMAEEVEVLDESLISIKILMEEGNFEDAFEMSKRLLEIDPGNTAVLNECGVALYQLDRVSEAYDCYQRMMEMGDISPESMVNYGLVLAEMGDLDASLSNLNRAIERDPYSEDGWNNKAVILYRAGRMREALQCLDEALRINERSIETWSNTGIILERMGEYGPAMECYQKILEIDPDNQRAKEGLEYCRDLV